MTTISNDTEPRPAVEPPADGWLPTTANIQALPPGPRHYIMRLETQCDPAGLVRENAQLKDTNEGLQRMFRNAVDEAARAFEIADEAMFELLLSEGCLSDGIDSTVIGFVDESCSEVHALAEACAAMREAFDWLQPRGYVELGTDQAGEFINVVRRPGEEVDTSPAPVDSGGDDRHDAYKARAEGVGGVVAADCTDPNRAACPRKCMDFCNKAEEAASAARGDDAELMRALGVGGRDE